MTNKVLRPLIILLAFVFSIAGVSSASLMLRQPSVDLSLNSGAAFSGGIILENVSSQPLNVKVRMADSADKDGKTITRACSTWIKLSEENFTLPANSIKDLRFTADIPKEAQGGYWTALVYTYDYGKVKGPSGMDVNIKMNIEEPFRIMINGTLKKNLVAEKTEALYNSGTIEVSSKVKNIGNTFEDVNPTALIVDKDGKVVRTINSHTIKAYPGEEYDIDLRGTLDAPQGKYKVISIFEYGGDKVLTVEKSLAVK